MGRSTFLLAVSAFSLAACAPPSTVIANSADPTAPSTLWLQASIPGKPMVNRYLGDGPLAAEVTATDQVTLTARADDPDGGLRSLRLLVRQRRPRPGNAVVTAFSIVNATNSSAAAGQPTSPSASVSTAVNAATWAGGGFEGGIEVMAEAENYAGQIVRSPVMSLCIGKVRLRVHVIPLSDDDGSRGPDVTRTQFADALQRTNRAFCGTGIQFQFDSTTHWAPATNTGMNRDQTIFANGNAAANALPTHVVIYLRWGGDPANRTGNGNAYPPPGTPPPVNFNDNDQRYVALPNLYPATGLSFLTLQNGSFMAHELGHYLGLYHTFPGWDGVNPVYGGTPTTAAQADQALVAYVRANGGTTAALDGDRIADTPPDPGVILFQRHGNQNACTTPSISAGGTVAGTPFNYTLIADPMNAMSYFDTCDGGADPRPKDFTPQQVARMHLVLSQAPRSGLLVP